MASGKIRRRLRQRQPVSASQLAQMGVCERLVVFEHRYGTPKSVGQRQMIERGCGPMSSSIEIGTRTWFSRSTAKIKRVVSMRVAAGIVGPTITNLLAWRSAPNSTRQDLPQRLHLADHEVEESRHARRAA